MPTQPDCVHSTLQDHIHIFSFLQPTRKAIDEWVQYLHQVHQQTPPDGTVRYMIDYRLPGFPPVAYGTQTTRSYILARPHRQFTYVAVLHQSLVMLTMAENVVKLLPGKEYTRVRFFTDEPKALQWLRASPDR